MRARGESGHVPGRRVSQHGPSARRDDAPGTVRGAAGGQSVKVGALRAVGARDRGATEQERRRWSFDRGAGVRDHSEGPDAAGATDPAVSTPDRALVDETKKDGVVLGDGGLDVAGGGGKDHELGVRQSAEGPERVRAGARSSSDRRHAHGVRGRRRAASGFADGVARVGGDCDVHSTIPHKGAEDAPSTDDPIVV